MTRTLSVTVGYLPQPFATPFDDAAGSDGIVWDAQRVRSAADDAGGLDQADAVISTASTAVFGGNFGGNF